MARSRPAELHSVFERTLHEQRRSIIAWAVGMAGLGVLMLAMYPTVHGNADFAKLLDSYPKALRSLFDLADYTSGPGYLRAEIFSLTGPLLIVTFAILWGGDLTAGEEERRTIDVLLANPISRRRVVLEKWLALATGVALVEVVLGAVLTIVSPMVGLHVGIAGLWAAILSTTLLALLFGTVSLVIGAATGRRGVARGLAALFAVGAYLLSALPEIATWLRPARPVSPWYQALGIDPLTKGFLPGSLILLLGVLCLGALTAALVFERRDLGT